MYKNVSDLKFSKVFDLLRDLLLRDSYKLFAINYNIKQYELLFDWWILYIRVEILSKSGFLFNIPDFY